MSGTTSRKRIRTVSPSETDQTMAFIPGLADEPVSLYTAQIDLERLRQDTYPYSNPKKCEREDTKHGYASDGGFVVSDSDSGVESDSGSEIEEVLPTPPKHRLVLKSGRPIIPLLSSDSEEEVEEEVEEEDPPRRPTRIRQPPKQFESIKMIRTDQVEWEDEVEDSPRRPTRIKQVKIKVKIQQSISKFGSKLFEQFRESLKHHRLNPPVFSKEMVEIWTQTIQRTVRDTGYEDEDNNLMKPRKGSPRELISLQERIGMIEKFHELSRRQWVNTVPLDALMSVHPKRVKYKLKDLITRACYTCHMVVTNLKKIKEDEVLDLYTMDGHGRWVYILLLMFIKHNLLLRVRLIVVDIDEAVHEWHDAFFPRGIVCIHGDIFDVIKKRDQTRPFTTTLNFCGLGSKEFGIREKILDHIKIHGFEKCNLYFNNSREAMYSNVDLFEKLPRDNFQHQYNGGWMYAGFNYQKGKDVIKQFAL